MKNVIYKIRNVVNGKFYVGSTVNSRKRFWAHRKDLRAGVHVCVKLQRAWNKYGEDCFIFEIVEQLDAKEALFPAEQKWLDEHCGKEYCYNISAHADAPMRDASPEMRAHQAKKTKEWIEQNGHQRQGAKLSVETIELIKKNRKAPKGENHYRYGQTVSEEVRKKIGDTQRGVKKPAGRKVSTEGKLKIQESIAAGRWSKGLPPNPIEEVLAKFPQEVLHKYDFTAAVYTGALNRIEGCVCPAHGVFSQYAAQFRKGRGCPSCGAEKRAESKRKQMKEFWASGEGKALFRGEK